MHRLLLAALLFSPVVATASPGHGRSTPKVAASTSVADTPAVAIARAYFVAMDAHDLDAAGALFDSTSSLFESGGVQGDWTTYRGHHLGPEFEALTSFKTTLGQPEPLQSADGTLAVVAWPIEFHVVLKDGRTSDSTGTVTFVLQRGAQGYRIRHLHWSSRPKSKAH